MSVPKEGGGVGYGGPVLRLLVGRECVLVASVGQQSPESRSGVEFHLDYLAVTMHGWTAFRVIALLARMLGDEWLQKCWDELQNDECRYRARGPLSSFVERDVHNGWTHLSLKGEACTAIGTTALLEFCREAIAQLGPDFKVSRVDLAWDDFDKRITPHRLRAEFWDADTNEKRDQAVSRAKRGRFHEDDPVGSGCSYYIGSRSSARMLRLYDKAAQSDGKVDSMRIELQNRDDAASAVIRAMVKAGDPVMGALGFLVGFLDFREPGSYGSHKERRKRCPFWAEFVGEVEKSTLQPSEYPDVEVWHQMFLKQTGGGFSLHLELCGGDVGFAVDALLAHKPAKPNTNHERLRRQVRDRRAAGEIVGPLASSDQEA